MNEPVDGTALADVDQDAVDDMDEAYDPDPDPDLPESNVPAVRSRQMRGKILQSKRPVGKKPRSVAKAGARILAKEKQRQALELRKGGASYAAIAQALGYGDQSAARKAVVKAFSEIIQEPAVEVKTIQIERLNHMLLTMWPKVQQGDERAIDTSLRVMDKIDRLMGTEAVVTATLNVNQTTGILVIDGSKEDYLRSLKQMSGIAGDGSNISQPAIGAAPPSGIVEGEIVFPADDGTSLYDALGKEGREAIHTIMGPPDEQTPYVPVEGVLEAPDPPKKPKKIYAFGVDPKKKEER